MGRSMIRRAAVGRPTLRPVLGWVPYWLDRLDEHYEDLGWMVPDIRMKPSDYFRRFVSTEAKDEQVGLVVTSIGADAVVFASDFPHYDAVYPGAVATFRARCGLDAAVQRAILGGNAKRLFAVK